MAHKLSAFFFIHYTFASFYTQKKVFRLNGLDILVRCATLSVNGVIDTTKKEKNLKPLQLNIPQ